MLVWTLLLGALQQKIAQRNGMMSHIVIFVITLPHHEPLAIIADAQFRITQNVNGQILGLAPLGVIENAFNPTFDNVIDLIPFLLRSALV
jgi:hypothetical protein